MRVFQKATNRGAWGVNVFGYLTSHQSQGVLARDLVRVLQAQGIPVALTDVRPEFGETGQDLSVCLAGIDEASSQPYAVTIFCFTPVDTLLFLRRQPRLLARGRVTAVVVALEHRIIRPEFLPVLSGVDLILTISEFVAEAVQAGVPGSHCVPLRQAPLTPPDLDRSREKWGVPPDAVLFVSAFDAFSDSTRKNPAALVRAFKEAFLSRADVALLMKIGHLDADTELGGQAALAVAEAVDDPRIQIVTRDLAYSDLLGLFASADVLVSLHRSEGLGLTLMESMAVGTVAMATNFSGNLDFMTPENSALVDYEMVPVATTYPTYAYLVGRDMWAEPSHEHAVSWLRILADDTQLRTDLASAGQRAMDDLRNEVLGGEFARALERAVQDPRTRTGRRARRVTLIRHVLDLDRRLSPPVLRHNLAVYLKKSVQRL